MDNFRMNLYYLIYTKIKLFNMVAYAQNTKQEGKHKLVFHKISEAMV